LSKDEAQHSRTDDEGEEDRDNRRSLWEWLKNVILPPNVERERPSGPPTVVYEVSENERTTEEIPALHEHETTEERLAEPPEKPRKPKVPRAPKAARRQVNHGTKQALMALLLAVLVVAAFVLLKDPYKSVALLLYMVASVILFQGSVRRLGRRLGNRTTFGQERKEPISGPRKWVFRVSGGRWNLGPSFRQRWVAATNTVTLTMPRTPVVIAAHTKTGGQGKTTASITVAQDLLEAHSGVSVLLIGNDPEGTLLDVTGVQREDIQAYKDGAHDEVCYTLLEAIKNRHAYEGNMTEVRRRFATMPGTGLFVLTYPEKKRPDPVELRETIVILSRLFPYTIWDCDQYIGESNTEVVLEMADVIAVLATYKDSSRIRGAANALEDLDEERFRRGRDRTVLVINKVWFNVFHRGTTRGLNEMHEARAKLGHKLYKGPVVTLPWNFGIKTGRRFLWVKKRVRFLLRNRSPWFRLYGREFTAALIEVAVNAPQSNPRQGNNEVENIGLPGYPGGKTARTRQLVSTGSTN
jgi:cellulose biosynthesis protein BcsQ